MRNLFLFQDFDSAQQAGFLQDGRHKADVRTRATLGWWPARGEDALRGLQVGWVIDVNFRPSIGWRSMVTAWCLRLQPCVWIEL